MRIAAGMIFAGTVSLLASSAAWSQTPPAAKSAASPAAPPAAAAPAPAAAAAKQPPQPARAACTNPNALGVGRTVEIDTTGGPGFGFEHFKQLDFLRDKEVVLTFDDGPWPVNTPARAEGAGRGMHHRHLLHHRQARDLLSGNHQAGLCRRPHRRHPHLVAHRRSSTRS